MLSFHLWYCMFRVDLGVHSFNPHTGGRKQHLCRVPADWVEVWGLGFCLVSCVVPVATSAAHFHAPFPASLHTTVLYLRLLSASLGFVLSSSDSGVSTQAHLVIRLTPLLYTSAPHSLGRKLSWPGPWFWCVVIGETTLSVQSAVAVVMSVAKKKRACALQVAACCLGVWVGKLPGSISASCSLIFPAVSCPPYLFFTNIYSIHSFRMPKRIVNRLNLLSYYKKCLFSSFLQIH